MPRAVYPVPAPIVAPARPVAPAPKPAPIARTPAPSTAPAVSNRNLPSPKIQPVTARRQDPPRVAAPPALRAPARRGDVSPLPPLGPVELASLGSPDGADPVSAPAGSSAKRSMPKAVASPVRKGGVRADDAPDAGDDRSEWAQARLSAALDEALSGRYEPALDAVREVLRAMEGKPLGEDALRGEDAIRRRMELGHLNPDGSVFAVVKRVALDDMRGSRWYRLFS